MIRSRLNPRPVLQIAGLVILALVGFATRAGAQTAGAASIQGTVTDPTGAVIPAASITLTATATHVQRTAKTDASGLYSFPNIPIGSYSLGASATGFQSYTQNGIVLEVGSSIAVNIRMSVGSATETVEVASQGLALQTEDTSFKQTIDQRSISELPLKGRQMTSLITLSGGAAPANDIQGSKSYYSSVVISIAGGAGNETNYQLASTRVTSAPRRSAPMHTSRMGTLPSRVFTSPVPAPPEPVGPYWLFAARVLQGSSTSTPLHTKTSFAPIGLPLDPAI